MIDFKPIKIEHKELYERCAEYKNTVELQRLNDIEKSM